MSAMAPAGARRGLVVVAVALAAALALCAQARADVTVTVVPEGGKRTELSLAALQPRWDVRDRPYAVGAATLTVSGISLDALLKTAGVDPFRFRGATVSAGGASVALTREQLIDPDAFADGRPLVFSDGAGAHFLVPANGAASARVLDPRGGGIEIDLARTSRLHVEASAARDHLQPGRATSFRARVSGARAGEQVSVRWTFDDGHSATGLRARHSFARPGTYKVVVGATTAADPAGAAAVVTVRVGKQPKGPDRDGGGTSTDPGAPDSGAATGSGPGAGDSRPPTGAGDPRGATDSGDSGAGAVDDAATPATTSRPAPAAASRERPAKPEPPRRARARPPRRARSGARANDGRVRGTLIDSIAPVSAPADTRESARAARTGNPRDDAPLPELPPEALFALAVAGLVGIGAWTEQRLRSRALLGKRAQRGA